MIYDKSIIIKEIIAYAEKIYLMILTLYDVPIIKY